MSVLYLLDLLGVAVFAVSGALAAGHLGLDPVGVIVFAALTAVGGGTLRDLLLGRHPIFWMSDVRYLYVIAAAALATTLWVRWFVVPMQSLLVADALGLALFALCGAQLAEARRLRGIVIVLLGTMTGVGGGVLRDVLSGQVPLLLRKDIYASAAIAGIVAYLLLQRLGLPRPWAFGIGLAAVAGIRLGALAWGWQLPAFRLPA
ncbi:trimeric intracellular cation channel family protein [Paucibacter sp. O1-1]|uniref:trimeric intracellular cation channel family protein n=1 Tax=unclassified Roseateles TaxID=2626991 RepID=UPI0021D49ED6|nr:MULTISPECIES: trimeric intracellular cation channel family protein [unclassified Roseateles]MCU7373694.1 trimeric intracellular cation channel family protein [Paucibacter sp. O1-1]MCZ7879987.1 trimeric intracellular cation channel family protein [Paucibacter sp. M5-1]MDA3828695.1 trimeric intracellular cation channel family protein [Paucibacter sp. O1-1]MDC6166793.1 trimeric intracellular cation channel family protein [Paucibacter sp. XJ19-41]